MRILITGSREWDDWTEFSATLWEFIVDADEDVTVVHGACPRGADDMAHDFCRLYPEGVTEEAHPADWEAHGKAAGFIRNQQMVDLGADVCIAFLKGPSRGTRHCAAAADKAGIPVFAKDGSL